MIGSNRRVRDPLIGQVVQIIGGEWKGYKGRVTNGDDNQLTVELTSKYRRVPTDRSNIEINIQKDKNNEGESVHGGQTIYESGKTP